jgi:hypothetical protein
VPVPDQAYPIPARKIDVFTAADGDFAFAVTVHEGASESRHRVSLANAAQFPDQPPSRIVRAAMDFLLDREPKESILPAFDIGVIRRYFPEFDRVFPAYLARLADSESQPWIAGRSRREDF